MNGFDCKITAKRVGQFCACTHFGKQTLSSPRTDCRILQAERGRRFNRQERRLHRGGGGGGGGYFIVVGRMGMCRWMGSHFHDWIDYNGLAFSKVTRMG